MALLDQIEAFDDELANPCGCTCENCELGDHTNCEYVACMQSDE